MRAQSQGHSNRFQESLRTKWSNIDSGNLRLQRHTISRVRDIVKNCGFADEAVRASQYLSVRDACKPAEHAPLVRLTQTAKAQLAQEWDFSSRYISYSSQHLSSQTKIKQYHPRARSLGPFNACTAFPARTIMHSHAVLLLLGVQFHADPVTAYDRILRRHPAKMPSGSSTHLWAFVAGSLNFLWPLDRLHCGGPAVTLAKPQGVTSASAHQVSGRSKTV